MAKVKGPLLGFDATGTIAKTAVFGRWRGVGYVRSHVIPANPRTEAQLQVRRVFKWLNDFWRYAPSFLIEAWDGMTAGQPLTGRNKFIAVNVPQLRGQTTITLIVFSAGYGGAPRPAAFDASGTTTAGEIRFSLEAPILPEGWQILSAYAVGVPQQNPHESLVLPVISGSDDTSPYEFSVTGLESGVTFVCGGFFKYRRPDGTIVYGPAINDVATTS
jgi:hypothetical protein